MGLGKIYSQIFKGMEFLLVITIHHGYSLSGSSVSDGNQPGKRFF